MLLFISIAHLIWLGNSVNYLLAVVIGDGP